MQENLITVNKKKALQWDIETYHTPSPLFFSLFSFGGSVITGPKQQRQVTTG